MPAKHQAHHAEHHSGDEALVVEGEGIHWPELDEDLSVAGMLAGHPGRVRARSHAGSQAGRSAVRPDQSSFCPNSAMFDE